jgi:hypothetical protein
MMNPEIKARWVAWLRANADKQTQGRLCRVTGVDAGYCCLGGLCEIAVEDGIISKEIVEDHMFDGALMGKYGTESESEDFLTRCRAISHTILPSAVTTWAGVEDHDPKVTVNGYLLPLTYVNDNMRLNFNQIADLIEEQL